MNLGRTPTAVVSADAKSWQMLIGWNLFSRRALSPSVAVAVVCATAASVALVDLGVRSAVYLNIRWDTFMYHLPFAALRGGLAIPYDMNDTMRPIPGIPSAAGSGPGPSLEVHGIRERHGCRQLHCLRPVPDLLPQGAKGAILACRTHIADGADGIDPYRCELRRPRGGAFLAIGVASCLHVYLFPDRHSRTVIICGLAGLAASAWSKYQLVPVVVLVLVLVRGRCPDL